MNFVLPFSSQITLIEGDYFIDGPIFMKSGVTLDGQWQDDFPSWTYFVFYEGENSASTGEDAVIVMDGVTDAEASIAPSISVRE